jgi:hypothetical protein
LLQREFKFDIVASYNRLLCGEVNKGVKKLLIFFLAIGGIKNGRRS